jgi:oligo-1,6-glucosidase
MTQRQEQAKIGPDREWWKEGIVYQIYPRSFKDTDGDGVGDLRGIIEKLDYIKSLNVDIIWLNPVYQSPNDDNGYDISNYRDIMTEFGDMNDFDELLAGLHERDIKLVMDLVVNHSSDEHEWFKQSRSSRDNPYRDYYHWWPAEEGEPPYRRGFFDPNNEGWLYDEQTNAYYLHYFGQKQPDLNWENPAVRKEVYDLMRFWFEKGVDGFRMDVIPFISKDTTWPVVTEEELYEKYGADIWARYYADGPNLHEYLREMNQEVLKDYDVMALGEGAGVTIDQAMNFVGSDRNELDLFFHFDGMGLGYGSKGFRTLDPEGWSLVEFKNVYTRWDSVFAQDGWGSIYLGNHDQPRMVTRWGDDRPEFREVSAKMLQTFILSMRGTPFIYHGDEIGMTNLKLDDIADYRDIETLNWYKLLRAEGKPVEAYMEDWRITARENGRSPIQWDDSPHGGFTDGTPWLKVNENYKSINVESQQSDESSVLNYFREMAKLRSEELTLVYGDYQLLLPEDEAIYCYSRTLDGREMMVFLNFTDQAQERKMDKLERFVEVEINNYPDIVLKDRTITLKPYQAVILSN